MRARSAAGKNLEPDTGNRIFKKIPGRVKKMLYDDLRKEKEARKKLVTEHGVCRFCGQMEALEVPPEWTEAEVDELATETCECAGASYYSSRKSRKERAHVRIEELFGQGDTQTGAVSEGAVELLHLAVDKAGDEQVLSVMVDAGDGIKASIKLTNKDTIKVTRTATAKRTYEV